MPGFNHVSLARHAHGLLVALQQVQARAPQGGRPVPPLLHEHISVLTAGLQRLHDQFAQLIGGDPLVVTRGDGGIRPDDVLHLVRWWKDGRLTHVIHKLFLLAVRDVATVCAKAPGGPSSANASNASSRTVSGTSSQKAGGPAAELERLQRGHAAFEQFLGTPRAAQCSASLVVVQGVLQLVLDAMQLLRNRPPASLQPPPPLPPPPPPPSEHELDESNCVTVADTVPTGTAEASRTSTNTSPGNETDGHPTHPAQPQPSELDSQHQPLAMESSAGSTRSHGNNVRHGGASSARTTAASGSALPQAGKLLPALKPAPAPSPTSSASAAAQQSQSPQPQASSMPPTQVTSPPPPPRPEDERYQRLCARHHHAERLHQAWSGLQDAVLDMLCNSQLLMNLTELLRYAAALLALPGIGGGGTGGAMPRTLALWRQVWSIIPLVAALVHSVAASAAISLLPPLGAAASGTQPPLHHPPPTPLMDPSSAALLLTALADSSLVPACCDLVLAVSRSALQNNSATRHNVALAAQQLLAASLRLSVVAEAGDAFKPSAPQPSPQPVEPAASLTLQAAEASGLDVTLVDGAASPSLAPVAEAAFRPCGELTDESQTTVSMIGTGQRLPSTDGGGGGGTEVHASETGARSSDEAVRFSTTNARISGEGVRVTGQGGQACGEGEASGGAAAGGKSGATSDGAGMAAASDLSLSLSTPFAAEAPCDGSQAIPPFPPSAAEQSARSTSAGVAAPLMPNVGPASVEGSPVVAVGSSVRTEPLETGVATEPATMAELENPGSGPYAGADTAGDVSGGVAPEAVECSGSSDASLEQACMRVSDPPPAVSLEASGAAEGGPTAAAEADEGGAEAEAALHHTDNTSSVPMQTPPSPVPPLPAGAAAALAVISSPAVQYFLCERQASAVVQVYSELAVAAPPPPGGVKTSVTVAASASETLSTTWIVEPMLSGAPAPAGAAAATGSGGCVGDTAALASGGVSLASVLDIARSCGLDLLPVPVLPWSVPVEAALAALPDMRAVQQAIAKAASAGGVATAANGGGAASSTAAVDASVGPQGHNLRTDPSGGAGPSGVIWLAPSLSSGSSSVTAAATIAGGPLGVQLGRRRKGGSASGPSGGGSNSGGGMVAGPKLPPLRMPLRQLDSDARRREVQKAQRHQDALEREAQLVALVKATAATWRGLITAAAAAAKGPTADAEGEGGTCAEYVYGTAGRPATPSGHVPSASRTLLQLISIAAVCRAASTAVTAAATAAAAAVSQSDGTTTGGKGGSPPRARSGRIGRGHGGDAAGGDTDAPEEELAGLLATLVCNLTASHRLCSERQRVTLHEQLASLLAAALAASQNMLARTGNPDVSTPLVAIPEACLAWMAEAEHQRTLELALSERETEAADLAAAEAEAAQLERALARPDEEFTDEEYEAWRRAGSAGGSVGEESVRGLSRAAEAVARAAAVRLTAAARDSARLRVAVGMCEACVRFLVAHHQGIVATLMRAGLLRPGLQLREEHRRHAGLLQQTLDMLAHLAACCASAVAEAHAPRALHAAAMTAAPPHRSPVALAAASHTMIATAVGATYMPVLRALHSALLSVRKCLAVCTQQLAAGGGAALDLEPVAGVCAVLCAFPGRLVAQLLPAHELAVLHYRAADTGGRAPKESEALSPSGGRNSVAGGADSLAAELSGLPSVETSAGDVASVKDMTSEPPYEATRMPFTWGLEPIIEVSELSSGISSYPSQQAQQRQRKVKTTSRRSASSASGGLRPDDEMEGRADAMDDLDSPQGGGRSAKVDVENSEQQVYDMDGFEAPPDTEDGDTAGITASSRRASSISASALAPERAARAAAAVAAAVPYAARAIASGALHTTVPFAWRVFTSLFLQLATSELSALELRRQQQQQQQRPLGISWAPDASFSSIAGTDDAVADYSTYSFSSSHGIPHNGGSNRGTSSPSLPPPPTITTQHQGSLGPASGGAQQQHPTTMSHSSALSAEQLAALSSATTGLWDLLHVLLAVHRGAGAAWPDEAFTLPADKKAKLRQVVQELQRPRTPDLVDQEEQQQQEAQQQQQQPERASQPDMQDGATQEVQLYGNGESVDGGAAVIAGSDVLGGSLNGCATSEDGAASSLLTVGGRCGGEEGVSHDGRGRFTSSTGLGTQGGTAGRHDGTIAAARANSRCSSRGDENGGGKRSTGGGSGGGSDVGGRGESGEGVLEHVGSEEVMEGMAESGAGRLQDGNASGNEAATVEYLPSLEAAEATEDADAAKSTRARETSAADTQASTNGSEPQPLTQQDQQQDGQQAPVRWSLMDKVPVWREASMLLEQVFSLSEAWQELKAAENALGESPRGGHPPRLWIGDVPAPVPAPPGTEPAPQSREPSAAALLASFLRGGSGAVSAGGGTSPIKVRRLYPGGRDANTATAAAAVPLPKLILTATEAAHAMAGASSGVGSRAASPNVARSGMPLGCSYAGCTSLAGASEVIQGQALICRCERVSYCNATCQMLDWIDGHHQVCKSRPRKNSAPPTRAAAAVADAVAAQAAAGFTSAAAAAEPIGGAAVKNAGRGPSSRRSVMASRR